MEFLRRFPINNRLWLLFGLTIVGIITITWVGLSQLRTDLIQEKEAQTRKLVETAHSIIVNYHQLVEKGELETPQAQQKALNTVKGLRYDKTNYFWINDMHPKMVMHPIKPKLDGKDLSGFTDPAGKKLFVAFVEAVRKNSKGSVDYLWPKPGSETPVPKVSYVMGFQPWGWIIGSGIYLDDVDTLFWESAYTLSGISLILLTLLLAASVLIGRSIIKPLKTTTAALQSIATGEGDLTRRLPVQGNDELRTLAEGFNGFVEKIRLTVSQVAGSSVQLASSTESLSTNIRSNSEGMARQRSETQQVATAITEMSATVQEIAKSAESAASAAKNADDEANNGSLVVAETIEAINSLASEVDRASEVINRLDAEGEAIGSVLDVIRGIAEQTNLLALNAAIEAARAGEQGRGFAVVADEVRTLASRTQQSTQEIQEMIERLQSGTREAVSVMTSGRNTTQQTVEKAGTASGSLSSIVSAVNTISDMNAQIASAAEEQTLAAQEIDRSVVQIAELADRAAQATAENDTASQELARLSEELQSLVGQFKT